MSTKEIAKTETKALAPIDMILGGLDTMKNGLIDDLHGTGIDPHKFLATAKTAVQKHQQKEKLMKADRNSLYLAVKDAAQQGLMPDNKEGALVLYNNKEKGVDEVSFQPMVTGIVKLLRQSGDVLDVGAAVVFANDKFRFSLGVDKMPEHTPDWFSDRGEPIGVWAYIKLTNGEVISKMLPKERLQRIAARSKMAKNYSPTEGQDWEEFWNKAAIRNAAKFAPKTPKLERALLADDNEFDMTRTPTQATNAQATAAPSEPVKETAAAKAVRERTEAKAKQAATVETQEQSNVIDAVYDEADDDNQEPPI
jgi:recombination protein RecT